MRLILCGALTLLATLALAAPAIADCPNQSSDPAALTPLTARQSLLCLVNEERAAHGLAPFSEELHLDKAARGHSVAMKRRHYFGHGRVWRRIRRSGYLRGASHYGLGEALGWGRGTSGAPASVLGAMMGSAVHRAELLSTTFREVGIGVARGSPITGRAPHGAIYTIDFGWRS